MSEHPETRDELPKAYHHWQRVHGLARELAEDPWSRREARIARWQILLRAPGTSI